MWTGRRASQRFCTHVRQCSHDGDKKGFTYSVIVLIGTKGKILLGRTKKKGRLVSPPELQRELKPDLFLDLASMGSADPASRPDEVHLATLAAACTTAIHRSAVAFNASIKELANISNGWHVPSP